MITPDSLPHPPEIRVNHYFNYGVPNLQRLHHVYTNENREEEDKRKKREMKAPKEEEGRQKEKTDYKFPQLETSISKLISPLSGHKRWYPLGRKKNVSSTISAPLSRFLPQVMAYRCAIVCRAHFKRNQARSYWSVNY